MPMRLNFAFGINIGGNMTLLRTPLHALHEKKGAKMVPFAGYDMPVQYSLGVLKEHLAHPGPRWPVRCQPYGTSGVAGAQLSHSGAGP